MSMNLPYFILSEQTGKGKGLPLLTCHTSMKTVNARTDWMNDSLPRRRFQGSSYFFPRGKKYELPLNACVGGQMNERSSREFHISHDASRLIFVFSSPRKQSSRVSREIFFNDLNFKIHLIQVEFQCALLIFGI